MLGIPLGLAYANASEWLIHKYVLHGSGRKRESFWSFHWIAHHRAAKTKGFHDPDYERSVFGWHAQGKEAAAVLGMAALHLPLFPVAPFFTGPVVYSAWNYYSKHKRAHLDPEWAREHLPWHYDHHMARNQGAHWCVTKPWFDLLMGTREPYAGTPQEAEDRARAEARRARKAARAASAEKAAA